LLLYNVVIIIDNNIVSGSFKFVNLPARIGSHERIAVVRKAKIGDTDMESGIHFRRADTAERQDR
jgi:hypothetical protein